MMRLPAWGLSLAVLLYGGFIGPAALAGESPVTCSVPVAAGVYMASAGGSTDWQTADPENAEPLGVCTGCFCAQWSEGYHDGVCLFVCGAVCAAFIHPVPRYACMASCLPGCWVPPQCIRVECRNTGDTCLLP